MREDRIEVREAKDGQHYWVRIAPNGEITATSELYTTKYGAERAARREADRGRVGQVNKSS